MKIDEKIYNNRANLRYISLLLLVIGAAITYFYYGTEPQETIGGFLCGLGLSFFMVFLTLKKPKT